MLFSLLYVYECNLKNIPAIFWREAEVKKVPRVKYVNVGFGVQFNSPSVDELCWMQGVYFRNWSLKLVSSQCRLDMYVIR